MPDEPADTGDTGFEWGDDARFKYAQKLMAQQERGPYEPWGSLEEKREAEMDYAEQIWNEFHRKKREHEALVRPANPLQMNAHPTED